MVPQCGPHIAPSEEEEEELEGGGRLPRSSSERRPAGRSGAGNGRLASVH